MNEVEEIKQRLDIVDLISQYVTLKKAGANYKGVCPFHNERTASLMVSPQKQIWKCFGCGKGGDHYKFVMEAEHLEFGDALRLLATKAGVTLQPRTQAEHQTQGRKERLFRINMLISRIYQKLLKDPKAGQSALTYLKKRGLSEKTIDQFVLGLAPKNFDIRPALSKYGITSAELGRVGSPEKFYNRVIFPIFDVLGNVIAFTGRALGEDQQPKYLNSPETPLFNKGRVLYGLNFARIAIKDKDFVVLVEGQMDVLALHQGGVQNTVASSGTAITETQLQTLSKYTTNFLLAFDNDEAGRTTTKKVIELLLKNDLVGKVVDFAPYKDAGELFEKNPKAWAELAKNAVEGVEWWIGQELKAAGNIQFVETKKKVIKAILPVLALIKDETRLDHYVGRLAVATASKSESVYDSLGKVVDKKVNQPTGAPTKPVSQAQLTNEEQFLALILSTPKLLDKQLTNLRGIAWQSEATARIASEVISCYNAKATTKVTNQLQFSSLVKNHLDTPLAEKMDSWQFWLESAWPNLDERLADELVSEKAGLLTTKKYEQAKEDLALQIRRAQEKGDTATIKNLMKKLSDLTKQGS